MSDENDLAAEPIEDPDDERDDDGGAAWYGRRGCIGRILLIAVLLFVAWYVLTHLKDCGAKDQEDRGAKVVVATVRVPNVVGMSRRDAIAALKKAGLGADVVELFDANAPAGTIASQSPAAGEVVEKGTSISINVYTPLAIGNDGNEMESDLTSTVPEVVGMMRRDAIDTLEAAGYVVSVLEVYSYNQPVGIVFDQNPPGGNYAEPGSTITITLSLGKTPPYDTTVPDLSGLTQSAAAAKVAAAGLQFRPMWQPNYNSVGRIYDQSPAPGTPARAGDYVHVLIGFKEAWVP